MKIAYLIIAYDQPNHLERMIVSLAGEHASFYVHIDKKSDISLFNHLKQIPNLHFINNRISVNHGGWSLTNVMIKLLQESSEKGYDYYQFLSGRDYPIKSTKELLCSLKTSSPNETNFINFYELREGVELYHHLSDYYFVDRLAESGYLKLPYRVLFALIRKIMPQRRFLDGMTPFRGSQWCCLHRKTVEYVINHLSEEFPRLHTFFQYSWGSDEIFFQSIILNSNYRWKCRYYNQDKDRRRSNENKAYLHYVDWTTGRERPAILVETDFEQLQTSEFFFARKFDQDKSKQLLDLIDQHLL